MLATLRRLAPLAFATILTGAAQAQVTRTCPGGDRVEAPDAGLAERVCTVLETALPQLAACHLPRDVPLTIEVTDSWSGEHPDCMGIYDCESDVVQVLPPKALSAMFLPDSIYRRIDATLMFESLITHEVTHALVYQVMGPDSGPRAQNEYMAYAMQYAYLGDSARAKLLEGHQPWSEVTLDSLNGLILAMAPDAFAARVWAHFSRPENGCEMFRRILSREIEIGEGPHP